MTLNYPVRSKFIHDLRAGIKRQADLEDGKPIDVKLQPGGYAGKGTITIRESDSTRFEVSENLKHPDRFAQRIRVAAWALQLEKQFGRFEIEHDHESGIVTIMMIQKGA